MYGKLYNIKCYWGVIMEKTIAAIATAPGEAGIGIVRISGINSIEILKKMYRKKNGLESESFQKRAIEYGLIVDTNNDVIDEAIILIMRAPNSYTAEDVVEIQCHGGVISVRKILELVLSYGANLAEPGEFTKRAFLNGRIDLAQAEAVIDIINAKTETGLNAAVNQLEGTLSVEIRTIMDTLSNVIAHIEASIDFPEHDIEEMTESNIRQELLTAKAAADILVESFDEGKIIRDGLQTAIIGRPNVGKSSLLNVLLKDNRAIVTDVPGTTRDMIIEYLNIGGILLKLIDTAGIRATDDVVEKIGVERTKEAIEEAELVIYVVDASEQIKKEDVEIIPLLKGKKVIVAANKNDLGIEIEIAQLNDIFGEKNIIRISAKNNFGIKDIEDKIKEMVFHGKASIKKNKMITNVRHKDLLLKAAGCIERALIALENGIPVDLLSVDVREAWGKLGQITGDYVEEDIIKEIFSKFCIGK